MNAQRPARPMTRVSWQSIRFLAVFAACFTVLFIYMGGAGPVQSLNLVVYHVTRFQAALAGSLLHSLREDVHVAALSLTGPRFSCDVDTGCNGMNAIALIVAGLASFPAAWPARVVGIVVLIPLVLAINTLRIAALFWTGVHFPAWFGFVHVYVWQVLVMVSTACLWVAWSRWSSVRSGR